MLELEESGCEIRYPDHFNLNYQSKLVKVRLAEIGKRYKEANNIPAENPIPSTTTLVHRFLNEGINQRGGVKEIIRALDPVLNILDKNPQHLKWAEETSALYLDGCVNQPVAGWSEICAFASIAEAPTMIEKMQSVKHLLVNDQIKIFVAETLNSQVVEVEAGNCLLREIHKKLLQEDDIAKPWLGVPGPIAYEGSIRTWLTDERIQEFYDKIKPILEKTPEQLAEFLCNSVHCKTWGEIAFPEAVGEINESYKQTKKSLWFEVEEGLDRDEDKDGLLALFKEFLQESELDQNLDTLAKIKELTINTLHEELRKKLVITSGEETKESAQDDPSSHVAANLVLPFGTDPKSCDRGV